MAAPRSCAAVVLAAGSSTRLGRPKQLVRYQGETLLHRTARIALEVGASPVLVVVGAQATECRAALADLAVTVIDNPDYAEGMGSSLRLGMQALKNLPQPASSSTSRASPENASQPDCVLLMVCDQPLLGPEHYRTLLEADAPGGIAAAEYNGRPGVPAVFARRHFPALASVAGDQGARALLRALPVTVVPMPQAAVDIDTPEQLDALSKDQSAS